MARKIRKLRSYDARTGRNTAGAAIIAKAFVERPVFLETAEGCMVREWKPEEMQSYSNADIAEAIGGRRAVERDEMLGTIPMSAVKYCVTKGWLWMDRMGLYWVTEKAATELKLPRKSAGATIRFLKAIPA